MLATVFIGFRYEGTIRGCTAEISWDEYIGRRENVLDIIEHTPVVYIVMMALSVTVGLLNRHFEFFH